MPARAVPVRSRRINRPAGRRIQLTAAVEQDRRGYVATCLQLQGCCTQGRTYEEAMRNIRDAIRLHLEERLTQGDPLPDTGEVTLAVLTSLYEPATQPELGARGPGMERLASREDSCTHLRGPTRRPAGRIPGHQPTEARATGRVPPSPDCLPIQAELSNGRFDPMGQRDLDLRDLLRDSKAVPGRAHRARHEDLLF